MTTISPSLGSVGTSETVLYKALGALIGKSCLQRWVMLKHSPADSLAVCFREPNCKSIVQKHFQCSVHISKELFAFVKELKMK